MRARSRDKTAACGVDVLVTAGSWTLQSAAELYEKTIGDLIGLLQEGGIRKPTFQALIVDLYRDFLHTAMEAMRDGLAA
jgi:hypothetical protein